MPPRGFRLGGQLWDSVTGHLKYIIEEHPGGEEPPEITAERLARVIAGDFLTMHNKAAFLRDCGLDLEPI